MYKRPLKAVLHAVSLGYIKFHEPTQQYRLVPVEYTPSDKISPTAITWTEMRANVGELGPQAQKAAENKIKWWKPKV